MIERGVEGMVCLFGTVRVFNGGFGRMGTMRELGGGRRVLDKLIVGAVAAVGDVTITGAAGVFKAAGCGAIGALGDFGAVVAVDAVGALGDPSP
jgi:hypothetical protein